MIEAVMFWNEPNNKSHWDFEVDPDWSRFAGMVKLAAEAVRAENGKLSRVLGGISPIDPEVPVRLVVRFVPEHYRFDHRVVSRRRQMKTSSSG